MTPEGDFQRAVYRAGELETHAIDWPAYDMQHQNTDLANRLEKFWHARGYPKAKVWVEREPGTGKEGKAVYGIRSNLVNGVPPK